jgi:1-carboxybiuret hydrolase
MSFDPRTASALEIAAAIRSSKTTAREVTETLLGHIASTHDLLNAFTCVTSKRALKESDKIDQALAKGVTLGPLAGAPYAVKNLFDLEGEITVAGSKINRSNPPAKKDATAVSRLNAAGAICLGALNMGEFAYDFVTNNPHDGACRNPRDYERSAGGSSGGSGAAVSAGLCPLTLGSDTNGSIRVPSSFCGIWGLRPTYGSLSRGGTFAFVDSLDTVGPFARSVEDLAVCYDVLSGSDPRDPATASSLKTQLASMVDLKLGKIRIAKLGGYFSRGGEAVVHESVDKVCASLSVSRKMELPEPELARTAAYIITASESGLRHLENLKIRPPDFDPVVRDRLFAGAIIPSAWLIQAQRFRSWWRAELMKIFKEVDVLIAPATPLRAPVHGTDSFAFNGKDIPLRPNIGLFTQPVSFIGLPVLAAPVQIPDELPCAVQLIGAPHSEGILLQVARQLEQNGICSAPAIDPVTHEPIKVA